MRKRILPLLLALCLLLLTACSEMDDASPTTPDNPPQSDAPIVDPIPTPAGLEHFSLPYFPGETMDGVSCPDGAHQVIGALLYEGLFRLDEHFEPQAVLAESFTYDPETMVCAVTLRSNVVFSDGSPLTAQDVAATLERARWSARYSGRLADVRSVTPEEDTVYIALKRPNASFAARLDIPIVKAGTENEPVPLGTGRYAWHETDSGAYLAPNSHYQHSQSLPLTQIPMVACSDTDAMSYAFFSREVQLVTWDLTGTVPFNATGVITCTDVPTPVMQFVGFNTQSPLFEDPTLRVALSQGIDRKTLVETCLLNHAVPAAFPISPASLLYPTDLERPYSPDAFATAMEEAGCNTGKERPLTMIVSSENTFRVDMARRIAEALSAYDIKITVTPMPWIEFQATLNAGQYDLYYGECKLTADWDLTAFLAPDGALNFSRYTADELPDLLLAASSTSGSRHTAALRALYRYLQQEAPIVPVCFKNESVLLPEKSVSIATPTATDPFYSLADWTIRWEDKE